MFGVPLSSNVFFAKVGRISCFPTFFRNRISTRVSRFDFLGCICQASLLIPWISMEIHLLMRRQTQRHHHPSTGASKANSSQPAAARTGGGCACAWGPFVYYVRSLEAPWRGVRGRCGVLPVPGPPCASRWCSHRSGTSVCCNLLHCILF